MITQHVYKSGGSDLPSAAGRKRFGVRPWKRFNRQISTTAVLSESSASVSSMEKVKLGNSDLLVSVACLGTMVRSVTVLLYERQRGRRSFLGTSGSRKCMSCDENSCKQRCMALSLRPRPS